MLEKKTILVTGGARGIGKAICLKFAQEGANVLFTDINDNDDFHATQKALAEINPRCQGYISDASNLEDSVKLIDQIIDEHGRLDALVNNAGITRDTLLMRMTEDQWDLVMKINLKSVFNMTKAVQKYMLKQKTGSIINMSSVVGVGGNAGQSNYAASKAGIIGFTKSVAKELGSRNIRCNAIAPGFIITEMTGQLSEEVRKEWTEKIPLKRGGTPEDVANTALFLASDISAYVSGQVINVCGGMQT